MFALLRTRRMTNLGTKVLVVGHTNSHRLQSRPQFAPDLTEIALRSRRDRSEIAARSHRSYRDRVRATAGPMLPADSTASRHVAGWHGIIAEA